MKRYLRVNSSHRETMTDYLIQNGMDEGPANNFDLLNAFGITVPEDTTEVEILEVENYDGPLKLTDS